MFRKFDKHKFCCCCCSFPHPGEGLTRVRKRAAAAAAAAKLMFNILSKRCTRYLLPFTLSRKYSCRVCNANLYLHVTDTIACTQKKFGSICAKIILSQHVFIFFHSRLENCQGKLHCYVCGGNVHNKKLECIRANRFLSLQKSPVT